MSREPIRYRISFNTCPCRQMCYGALGGVSAGYSPVTGKLLTCYAPFRRSPTEYCYSSLPLDLHVLSLPLAFILSQDQTLLCIFLIFQVQSGTLNSFKEINALDSFFVFFGTCFLVLNLPVFSMNSVILSTFRCSFSDSLPLAQVLFRCPCFVTGLQRYTLFLSLQTFPKLFFIIFFLPPPSVSF